MTYKKIWATAILIVSSACTLQAQTDDNSVTITNHNGKIEIIDTPESMTTEIDSLMQLYNSKM